MPTEDRKADTPYTSSLRSNLENSSIRRVSRLCVERYSGKSRVKIVYAVEQVGVSFIEDADGYRPAYIGGCFS